MRRFIVVVLTLSPLAACATSERRLDEAWAQFQTEHAAVMSHNERVQAAAVDEARASGDDDQLVFLTMPPEAPVARALDASTLASLAYLNGDLDGIDAALQALRRCDEDLRTVERQLASSGR